MEQRLLVEIVVLVEQHAIGWDLCFQGYLSHHWALVIAAHPLFIRHMTRRRTTDQLDTGKTWAWKTVYQLWESGWEMWLHHKSALHDPNLMVASR
jgi:hypothetical protein